MIMIVLIYNVDSTYQTMQKLKISLILFIKSYWPTLFKVQHLLEKDLGEMRMIMSGDFNINFNTDEAQPLLRFLDEKFKLKLNTDKGQTTARLGTTIDAVFSRYLEYF